MAERNKIAFQDTLSPEEMQGWLDQEIRDSAKAHELRIKEATEFVTSYAAGKITPDQAVERLIEYDRRWGDALFGATAHPKASDEEILSAIDSARRVASADHRDRISQSDRKLGR